MGAFAALISFLLLVILALVVACLWLWARNRRLAAMALVDPLTGLPNRRGLQRAWSRLGGEKALLFIDLDGFKAINDEYGHAVGDALLRRVARRLADAAIAPGMLARWGGDEFAAVVPAGGAADAERALRAMTIRGYDLVGPGPVDVRIGLSIGICTDRAVLDLDSAVSIAATHLLEMRAMRRETA